MPKAYSRRRVRDAAFFEEVDRRGTGGLDRFGITADTLKKLKAAITGHVVLPGDPTYDQDRLLFNPVFNPMPSLIVFCLSELDVAVALDLARAARLPFTLRSGGHCTAGFSAGFGILIDVKGMDAVRVDTAAMQAEVGAGCDFGRLNKILAAYGLHVPAGECEDVCVGGFVQGGGLGFTSTTFGMNCDNVVAMRVLLGDGRVVVANPTTNRDLWWAMRGGTGGNFGVLLSVTYRLYALGDVTGFALAWKMETAEDIARAADALMLLQSRYMRDNPYGPKLNLQALMVWQSIIDPNQPPLPKPVCVLTIRGLWIGDPAAVPAIAAPLLALPGAVHQWTMTGGYSEVLDALLGNPQDQPIIPDGMGMPNEDKASRYVAKPLDKAKWVEILTFFTGQANNTMAYMYLELYGGAIERYPAADSAFVHRDVLYNAVLDVFWYAPKDRLAAEAFLNGWTHLMQTVWNEGVYQNYASINVPDYTRNYWGDAVQGLALVKRKYDPARFFDFAQAVPQPGAEGALPPGLAEALARPIDPTGGAMLRRPAL
ncbi:FAD-binding protein [Falsiroseomonas sp. HW251]|uniref:FAD-dependent oxidoreductase n=1 Tax=Falsiroseomonas sp. HW251 TaxID=3390998 RepID=UPI003D31682E